MSNNRLRGLKPKLEDPTPVRKDLTPKSSKYSPKISPVYSSIRQGISLKPDPNSKIKITRPSTSKNASQSKNFFHSKDNNTNTNTITSSHDTKKYYTSTSSKRVQNSGHQRNAYEYQPRSKSKSPIRQPDEIVREEVYLYPKAKDLGIRDIRVVKNPYPPLPKVLLPISNFQPAKHSVKSNGNIKAYAASTNQGPIRDYNEDRVAIILNIPKPENCTEWKKVAYFGVFDGHGGTNCADYLRDNLHIFVSKQKSFPSNMKEALLQGFDKCQKQFNELSFTGKLDRSGSCAIVAFFHGNECYVANVGDSRAIMSSNEGKVIKELSIDHKASDDFQQKRITDNGGKIYQTKLRNSNPNIPIFYEGEQHPFIMGPHRVFPGRLSVTRTFGDIEAKFPEFNGNPKAIVCEPQVRSFTITQNDDFILLACKSLINIGDGIYDKLSNEQVISIVWDTLIRQEGKFKNVHQFCGKAVENIMKLAFNKKTLDNITVVMIALDGLNNYFLRLEEKKNPNQNKNNYQTISIETKPGVKKTDFQMERKYIGRSTSPSANYASLRTKSFY